MPDETLRRRWRKKIAPKGTCTVTRCAPFTSTSSKEADTIKVPQIVEEGLTEIGCVTLNQ